LALAAAWGTILVDLETRTVADVLPARSPTSLAMWLSQHPGVEIACWDRHGHYAEGARAGAPQGQPGSPTISIRSKTCARRSNNI
jgi:transposase